MAQCAIENTSPRPVEINLAALSSASLALEIMNSAGEAVLLPPPPVPPVKPLTAVLQSGQRHQEVFTGFMPTSTPAGSYRVRCRYVAGETVARSEWVGFDLA